MNQEDIKAGDKFICPDGSINTVVAYDADLKHWFVIINGCKCCIDGDDYIKIN